MSGKPSYQQENGRLAAVEALRDNIITTDEWGRGYDDKTDSRYEIGFREEVNRHFGLSLVNRKEMKKWYLKQHVHTPEWQAHA